jgi:hypothetical protein
MSVDDLRISARRELEALGLSAMSASYLVDERPRGGWDALVTRDELRAEIAGLRVEMASLASELRAELRDQTWQLAKLVIAAQAVVVAALAGVGALLRFA